MGAPWFTPFQMLYAGWNTFTQQFNTLWQRAPKPTVFSIEQVATMAAQVTRVYTGDPLGGAYDYSEHPSRIEWFRSKGKLIKGVIPIDCDDVANYVKWLLMDKPWVRWVKVINVYDNPDLSRANFSHCVCWFELMDGRRGIIDTNVIWGDEQQSYRGPYFGPEDPTQYCQRMYGNMGAVFTGYAETPWLFV